LKKKPPELPGGFFVSLEVNLHCGDAEAREISSGISERKNAFSAFFGSDWEYFCSPQLQQSRFLSPTRASEKHALATGFRNDIFLVRNSLFRVSASLW